MSALLLIAICLCGALAHAQNVVEQNPPGEVLEPIILSPGFVDGLLANPEPRQYATLKTGEAQRVLARLEGHIAELIDGWPWRPLHHVLGISGAETCFDHPDELFYSVSLAIPFLRESKRNAVLAFLTARLAESPPYGADGFERGMGRPRESFTVPEALRASGRGTARSAFGVASFAMCIEKIGDLSDRLTLLRNHWPAICDRMKPLLEREETFNVKKRGDGTDEAERLNGDLAGFFAFARLARDQHDAAALAETLPHVQRLAQFRINLERVNSVILEKTNAASKRLHNYKLARYCGLTADIAEILRGAATDLAANRLRAFRTERNGWYLALGDRLVGGENYTNPLHFGRAIFAGAALIEKLPAEELLGFIDVPSCKADFYFIERCALALESAAAP